MDSETDVEIHEAEILAAEKVLASRSLHHFVRLAWPLVEPDVAFIDNWHIEAICEHLEAVSRGQIRNLLINVPPGCCKSLLTSVFWLPWVWTKRPGTRWLFACYSQELSMRDSVRTRLILESNWYQTLWRQQVRLTDHQNQKLRYTNTKSGERLATTVGGRGTGEHPDFIIVDDPHNVKKAESDKQRQAALDWWSGTMTTRGKMRRVRRVVIMQRLHDNDLSAMLLESGQWEHLCLPMEYEPDRMRPTSLGFNDPRTRPGELLWEAAFNQQAVEQLKKELGGRSAGQLQQRPTRAGGSMFLRKNFRYFKARPLEQFQHASSETRLPPRLHPLQRQVFGLLQAGGTVRRLFAWDCWWFQACDTATSDKEHSAYTVVGTFAVTPQNELLVVDMARAKLEVPKQYGFLIAQRLKYPFLDFQAIEEASSGIGLIQLGKSEGTPFKVLTALGSKETRASTVSIMYENGLVYHRLAGNEGGCSWLNDLEEELIRFPNGKYKDQVDVIAYAGLTVVGRAANSPNIRTATEEEVAAIQQEQGLDLGEIFDVSDEQAW